MFENYVLKLVCLLFWHLTYFFILIKSLTIMIQDHKMLIKLLGKN